MDQKGGVGPKEAVLDCSGLIDGILLAQQQWPTTVLVPSFLIAFSDKLVASHNPLGAMMLQRFARLRTAAREKSSQLELANFGELPGSTKDIMEVDELVRRHLDSEHMLLTSSPVAHGSAIAQGFDVIQLPPLKPSVNFLDLLTADTLSLHAQVGCTPVAKKGTPGSWQFVECSPRIISEEDIIEFERSLAAHGGVLQESETAAVSISTYQGTRILIAKPALCKRRSLTITKPTASLPLTSYKLSPKLKERLGSMQGGIIIAGAPGHGKSTLAAALAREFARQGKITYTVESPTDMVVPGSVIQLSKDNIANDDLRRMLLLGRPDFVIFDEVRSPSDIALYADLRLAGIGLIGVLHADKAVDAVTRMQQQVDIGLLSSVFDTVLYVRSGSIAEVARLTTAVKVPQGIADPNLARPVVEIRNFETEEITHELYSYGDGPVIVEARPCENAPLLRELIETCIKSKSALAEVTLTQRNALIKAPQEDLHELSLRSRELEKLLGIRIRLESKKNIVPTQKIPMQLSFEERYILAQVNPTIADVTLYANETFLGQMKVGGKGSIRIRRENPVGVSIEKAIREKKEIIAYSIE